jgi:hypothetical protein
MKAQKGPKSPRNHPQNKKESLNRIRLRMYLASIKKERNFHWIFLISKKLIKDLLAPTTPGVLFSHMT